MLRIILALFLLGITVADARPKKKVEPAPPPVPTVVEPKAKLCIERKDYVALRLSLKAKTVFVGSNPEVEEQRIIVSTINEPNAEKGLMIAYHMGDSDMYCVVWLLDEVIINHDEIINLFKSGKSKI